LYPSRADVQSAQWVAWLQAAKRRCILLGTSHSKWCTDPDFKNALQDRLNNKVDIKILFLNPIESAVKVRAKEEKSGRDTVHEIKTAIRVLWEIRTGLPADQQLKLKLCVYEATPSMEVTWIDDRFMVVTHILAGSMNVTSPCLVLEPSRYNSGEQNQDLYETYAANVQRIENEFSEEITEGNVHNYLPAE